MSRSVRRPNVAPRPTGSFIEPWRGVPSRTAVCARRRLRSSPALDVSGTASRRRAARPLTGLLGSAVLALAPAFDCLAESRIGRLFSTVEQRIELDRVRDRPAVERAAEPVAAEVEAAPRLAPGPEPGPEPGGGEATLLVTVNGLVVRSDGHRLAWVDGVETGVEVTTPGSAGIEVERVRGGRVRIRLPERGVDAELKPGQTIDVARGSVFEAYESRPVRGAARTSGAHVPEPGIADPEGVRCPDRSPIGGCRSGSVDD